MNWFQALMPKEGRFFDLFERHAETLCAGAGSLHRLLEGGPETPEHGAAVAKHENDADEITREVMLLVRRTFITPFDRADIIDHGTFISYFHCRFIRSAKQLSQTFQYGIDPL